MVRLIIILFITFALGLVVYATIKYPDPIGVVAVMILSVIDTGFVFSLVHDKNLGGEW